MTNRAHKDAERDARDDPGTVRSGGHGGADRYARRAAHGGAARAGAGGSAEAKAQENCEQLPARGRRARERSASAASATWRTPIATAWREFAAELLEVRDSLEAGLEAGEKADARSLLAGKEATLQALAARVREVRHRARSIRSARPSIRSSTRPSRCRSRQRAEPNSVLQVVQKGYQLNGRLLRPARVIVAKAPGRAGKRRREGTRARLKHPLTAPLWRSVFKISFEEHSAWPRRLASTWERPIRASPSWRVASPG